ncbi:MAG: hypothetical protein K2X64_05010 [Rhodocyclaceae bacterium]|nr:hypothetical protein [Rhodocyclaceae bacterium]
MDNYQFIDAIKLYVEKAAITDVIDILKKPPGRRVSPEERSRSDWYNQLSTENKTHVESIIADAAHMSLFGIFTALDGVRKITDEPGHFEIYHVQDSTRQLIHGSTTEYLHDIFNTETSK